MSQGLTGVPQATARQASTASATTVTLPNGPMDATYPISGTTTITSITAGQAGRRATLEFASANCTVVNGSNLKLAGRNFVSTVQRTLDLESDGTNWIERCRGDFGTTTPTTLALGGSAAAGTVGESADVGHTHGFPIPAPTIGGVLGTDGSSALWVPSDVDNVIFNGAAEIAQSGDSFTSLVNGTRYIDGWNTVQSGSGVLNAARTTSPTSVLAVGHAPLSSYQFVTVATADASIAAGDVYGYEQIIEGWNARKLVNGSALSFWCYSTRGGTFTAFMQTRAGAHSYIREFVMPANGWTYVTTTFPAWTSIDGDMRSNIGCYVGICFAAGSTFQGAKDTWLTGSHIGTSTMTNNMDTLSAILYFTNFNLIPGLVPMPYQPRDYQAELARAMRYRQVFGGEETNHPLGIGQVQNSIGSLVYLHLPVPMLSVPTLTVSAAGDWLMIDTVGSGHACTSVTIGGAAGDRRIAQINTLVASGLVSGNATQMLANGTNARLTLEAYPT